MTTKYLLIILFSVIVCNTHAHSILKEPVPHSLVNDYSNLLSASEKNTLENKLIHYDYTSSNQIAIVIVKSLEGYSAADLSQRIAEYWGVGQKKKDNGILLLIKPKYRHEKGQVYISVGYGLEHVVPDAKARRLVDRILIPNFKRNNYYKGISETVDKLIAITNGEYTAGFMPMVDTNTMTAILIIIGITLLLIPITYLIFLNNRKVSEEFSHFYIQGVYNIESVLAQLDEMETRYNKNYYKFRKRLSKYNRLSRGKLIKYEDQIDRNMFCYLLDGRNRKKMFWQTSDPYLKVILFYIILIGLFASVYMAIMAHPLMLLFGLIMTFIAIKVLFSLLITFVEMLQHSLRFQGKYVGGVSVSLFALYALFKTNVKKRYNEATGSYTFYPVVHTSSYGYGSGSGGFGGSGYSGGGFGGFGGGGFGGGGAGGSW